jgi:hypothetical protein
MKATPTDNPAAPPRKFWDASAATWLKGLIVVSPAYACQVVVVEKLTAVLKARSGVIGVVTRAAS